MVARYMISILGSGNVNEHWDLIAAQGTYTAKYHKHWEEAGIDALICPVTPFPAPPIGHTRALFPMCVNYTMVYNMVNCPAGVVPVTKVTDQDVKSMQNYPTKRDRFHKWIHADQLTSVGLPIGVQVITETWQEELCLRVMREIQEAIMDKK